jgi:hypothetical protein
VSAGGRAAPPARLGPDAQAKAARLSGAIYGTILVAAILVASTQDDEPAAIDTSAYVVGTAVVFWLAHAWAHKLARQAVGAQGAEREFAHALREDWPLGLSCVPPVVAIAVASLLGASDLTAINAAIWLCVALLAGWGAVIAHGEGASWARVVGTGLGSGALGLLMVLLNALVH